MKNYNKRLSLILLLEKVFLLCLFFVTPKKILNAIVYIEIHRKEDWRYMIIEFRICFAEILYEE